MFTLELIIFILSVLAGILVYWRESKNNSFFRLVNRITHSKEQQMKKTDRKGFFFMQPFLVRFVYIVLFVLIGYLISEFLTPVRILNIKYFATIIVGAILGTYFASMIVFTSSKVNDGQDIIEETLEKGKAALKDLTSNDETTVAEASKEESNKEEAIPEKPKEEKTEKESKKSARERLKDKGYLK